MFRRVIPGLVSKGRALSAFAVKDLKLGSAAAAGSVSGSEVLIKMVAAPINSGDLTTTKSGSEGVGMVTAMGDKVTGLREGDWVFPPYGTSSWASEMVVDSSKLMRVRELNIWLVTFIRKFIDNERSSADSLTLLIFILTSIFLRHFHFSRLFSFRPRLISQLLMQRPCVEIWLLRIEYSTIL